MNYNKLLETAERCINDEPAACTARCPIHVDIAALAEEIEKGGFDKAYKILEKRMPFPRLIGMICDHPCEGACVREQTDRAVCIGSLEQTAVLYGYTAPKKPLPVQKKLGRVAVAGGGLSGIVAACELNKKGFEVTVFEETGRLGGCLWAFAGDKIERTVLEEELRTVTNLGIRVITDRQITVAGLKRLTEEYHAVYLGTGEWEAPLDIHPETFQVGFSSVFAGGRLTGNSTSVIHAVSSGKRAASSIERYVKNISMTASRDREGAFVSPLQYDTEDVEQAGRVEKSGAFYSKGEAEAEAARCLKCRCIQCVKACSHMKKFSIAPKAYMKQIQINENVIMGAHYANRMINSCTLCGLCKVQCPRNLDMKAVVQETRESMVDRGKMPASAHDFALRDMEFSNSSHFYLVKSPPPIPAEKREERERELFTYPRLTYSKYAQSLYNKDKPGTEKVDYLFYPGCQLPASSPDYVEKTYAYLLSRIKEGVGLMLGCCGAPADWAGRLELMAENAGRIKKTWLEMGKPTFILACSSCYRIFEKYLPDVPIVSLWEIFTRYGLPESTVRGEGRLNIHDACATRKRSAVQDSVRQIVSGLGYEVRELKYSKEKTKCCGYGGLVYYANREQSVDFVRDRIGESPDDLLVYCAMCKDLFVDGGKRTYHILDLIFGENLEALGRQQMPSLTQRHRNRADLKNRLLKELWHEAPELETKEQNKLIIPPDILALMEARYILLEDVEQVVEYGRSSGSRFVNPKDGSYLTGLRVKNVTYWVGYEERDDVIRIKSVYSHRMEILEEQA